MAVAAIILAAGKGTRMKSDLPKVLHPIGNVPMVSHVITAANSLDPTRMIVVAGHGADAVAAEAQKTRADCEIVLQNEQLGTGHAVDQTRKTLKSFDGNIVVLFGDSPMFQPDTLEKLVAALDTADVVVLGFEAADPARYGRLIMDGDQLDRIVEFKDANDQERAVTLCNSGVMAASSKVMFDMLSKLENANASGEYYLTDVVAHARAAGLKAAMVECPEAETLGVNSRKDLAAAEAHFQAGKRASLLDAGVAMQAPDTVHLSADTQVAAGVTIEPFVVFGPNVTVKTGSIIKAFSHLEGADVGPDCMVGPYARLRPGSALDQGAKIGNFVETKAAQIGQGAKVNHLSYIGDATVGPDTNIGAGTITCNYDGVLKHKTTIGAKAFIGSNTMLVAPVTVGDEAMTASGSVITKDVPEGALAIARAKQDNKDGFARRLMDKLRAIKAKRKGQ